MIDGQHMGSTERTLGDLLAEIKDEAFEFLQTRAQMLVSEVHENFVSSRKAVIYGVLAFTLLGTGYLLLTLALVGLVALAFWGSPYAWFFSFLIVGLLWSILGTMFAVAARADFKGLAPRRTIKVLKEDKSVLGTDPMNQS
ncbi:MAG: phage holin family protein [Candidatus Sulfotelmatobacter sp.]